MLNNDLTQQIKQIFSYAPTEEQEKAINSFTNFLLSPDPQAVFVMRGYAGTGKTSLVGAMVKMLSLLERKCVLLAPTGRAAKVFARHAAHPAYTVHGHSGRKKISV